MDDSFDDFKTPTGSPVKENPSALEQIVFDGIEQNATKEAKKRAELDELRAAGVELSDDDMYDSDNEAPQTGPMVEDDPDGVDFDSDDNESNMLAKQMQFTPADSTMVFELNEKRIMEEAIMRENENKSPDGDETALLEGTMCDNTVNMNDTDLLDQTTTGNEFKQPPNPAEMTVIDEDDEICIKIKSSAKKFRTPASTSSDRAEDKTIEVGKPNLEETDLGLSETIAGKTILEVTSGEFEKTEMGFENEEAVTVEEAAPEESNYATALTTPVVEASPLHEVTEKPKEEAPVETSASPAAEEAPEPPKPEETEEIPPPAKGAYTMDFDKFDDPNFNPFATSKTAMRNSPEPQEDIPVPKGSYSVDYDKFDDPNFNPFESKKAMQNSPTPENQPNTSISIEANKTIEITAKPEEVTPAKSESEKENNHSSEDLPSSENVNTTVTIAQADEIETQSQEFKSELASTETQEEPESLPQPLTRTLSLGDKTQEDQSLHSVIEPPTESAMETSAMSVDEEVANISQEAEAMDVDNDELHLPKGAYSMDFDKIDDPNFNPFESKKAMQNSPTPDETPLPPKGAYTVDLDKFDDPNFNPFESKRAMANSPVEKSPVKETEPAQESVSEPQAAPVEASIPDPALNRTSTPDNTEDPAVLKEMDKTFSPVKEAPTAEALSKEGLDELNQTFTPPKRAPPKLGQRKRTTPVKKKSPPKPKPKEPIPEPPATEDDAPLPAKGAYSIDFDKFDDPNFNPFESKKAMSNSPTPGEDEIKPKSGAYTMDFDKFDDPNFNPFESKGPKMANSPPPSEVKKEEKESESAPANDEERAPPKLGQNRKKVSPKVIKPKALKPKVQAEPEPKPEDEETPLPAKGAYNIDFDKFDDPNFNPFETKKAMRNSPELDKTIEPEPEKEPELEKLDEQMADPDYNPFETKSAVRSSPSPVLAKPKTTGYTMDFDKFDDPNFNPFETKKGLSNVEVSPEEVSPQNLTKTISKSDLNTTTGSDDFHSADEGNDENEDPNRTFEVPQKATEKGDSISTSFAKEKSFMSTQSAVSQENYIRALEQLLFEVDASYKKKLAASETLICRKTIENEQLKADLAAVEQASADQLQRHMRVKEKCILQAQNEEKLRKNNDDLHARHQEDLDRFDALHERSNKLVAKANEEIEKIEQETTVKIRCLEVDNKKKELEMNSMREQIARLEKEKKELLTLCDELVNNVPR